MRTFIVLAVCLLLGVALPAAQCATILREGVHHSWGGPYMAAASCMLAGLIGSVLAAAVAHTCSPLSVWKPAALWAEVVGTAVPLVLLAFRWWRRLPVEPYFHSHSNPWMSFVTVPAHAPMLLATALGAVQVGVAAVLLAPVGAPRAQALRAHALAWSGVGVALWAFGAGGPGVAAAAGAALLWWWAPRRSGWVLLPWLCWMGSLALGC